MREARTLPLGPALLLLAMLLRAPLARAADMVSVDRAQIHMRAGPGTGYSSLWMLGRGYPMEVTDRRGQWMKVRDFERDIGWVYRPLMDRTPHHVVTVPVVNIRSAPSTKARIVGKAEYGEALRTLDRRQQWVKVRQEGGASGWVSRRLLWGW